MGRVPLGSSMKFGTGLSLLLTANTRHEEGEAGHDAGEGGKEAREAAAEMLGELDLLEASPHVAVVEPVLCGSCIQAAPLMPTRATHTSAYVRIRPHTSAYVSIREHT